MIYNAQEDSARTRRRPTHSASAVTDRLGVALLTILSVLIITPQPLRAQAADEFPPTQLEVRVNEQRTFNLTADDARGRVRWRVVSGAPHPDFTLDENGVLRGRASFAQDAPFRFTVEATDSSEPRPQTIRQDFEIFVRSGIRGVSVVDTSGDARRARASAAADAPSPCDNVAISNSDTISIAVRNDFAPAGIIDLGNQDNPITAPGRLITDTLGRCEWAKDDYVIVHLVQWPATDPPAGGQGKYEVKKERWFLFKRVKPEANANTNEAWEPQTVQEGRRIYGHRRVGVLLVHIDARETWDIKYKVELKEKLPANIQNALDLAGVIISGRTARTAAAKSYWGGRLLEVKDIPSDITVRSDIAFVQSNGRGDDKQTQQAKEYSNTYDNEGRYHWDVSVGMPFKSVKEVQYSAENGQVTAREVTRQNAYGFLNLFFNPGGVDTKGAEFVETPHLVLGVPISGKPLDRPMIGLGMGVYKTRLKFNLFGGVVFNRVREPRTLAAGQAATEAELESDFRTRRVRKFIFGINLPVQQFVKAITQTKK